MIWLCLWVLAVPPMIAQLWFIAELLCGLRTSLPVERSVGEGQPSSAIVIPAHDEFATIGEAVAALHGLPGCRTLVVADNCTDQTAAVARAAGAEVIERIDPDQRGKGYALAFARDHLAQQPPAVVIIVDADCRISHESVAALNASVTESGQPAQAIDIMEDDLSLPPLAQLSNFAMRVKNVTRLRGLQRLGGMSLLCGTGMAFAWDNLADAPLATGDVVEDLGLTIAMIRSGLRPKLVEAALVTSPAATVSASITQRSRWEQGFLATARRQAFPLLWRGLLGRSRAEFALGMHLLVPPLALLILVSTIAFAICAVASAVSGLWLPTICLGTGFICMMGLVFAVWVNDGRRTLSLAALLNAPLYVLWKLPIYLRLLGGRKAGWTRTQRDRIVELPK